MMELLTAASPSRFRSKSRIRVSPVVNFRFSFIHPTLGMVTIRNATPSDNPALREFLCKASCRPHREAAGAQFTGVSAYQTEQEWTDLICSSTILMITSPREEGDVTLAAIIFYKSDLLPDLRCALERSTDDGNDTVRIDRFSAFSSDTGFDRRPIIVGKNTLVKVLGDARRKQAVILVVRDIVVHADFRETDILKFVSQKTVRILKYAYRCSHIISNDCPGVRGDPALLRIASELPGGTIDSGAGSDGRGMFAGIEFGYREPIDPQRRVAVGSNGKLVLERLRVFTCETIFDIRPKRRKQRKGPPVFVRELYPGMRRPRAAARA